MKTKSIYIVITVLVLLSCNTKKSEKTTNNIQKVTVVQKEMVKNINPKGLELMKQKCFSCHFEKPDPSKKDQMIAPPMLRVQEHYKPSYPLKADFVKVIREWVQNPIEAKTLMPGALRKFNIMPELAYSDEDLNLIAETLFDMDFGNMPKMNKGEYHQSLKLNDGKKWNLKKESIAQINSIEETLKTFESKDIADYNNLGKKVFDKAKLLLLDDSYPDEVFQQLHAFFANVEGNIHLLIATKTIDTAKKQQNILKTKFTKFNDYFE